MVITSLRPETRPEGLNHPPLEVKFKLNLIDCHSVLGVFIQHKTPEENDASPTLS